MPRLRPGNASILTAASCCCLFLCTAFASWDKCPATSEQPCSPSNQLCGDPFVDGPAFHVRDVSCGLNDPNGPFYDERHKLYHLFYQDHIGRSVPERFVQGFEGPSWGHAVSPDLIRWAHAPVAMWNGEDWYDVHALFTGSATVIDGAPVIMFPGVCDIYPPSGKIPGCDYGYTFGVARPANLSDPFYTVWSKSPLNPIVNNTFDDPSTAWRTSFGEWRWIANCGDGTVGDCGPNASNAPLYGSRDPAFRSAHRIGFTNLAAGECPSLYPLPPLSPGTTPAPNMPTHVHKWGCEPYKDCVELGTWHEGADGVVGWWEAFSGPIVMDQGSSYASKDLWDSKRGRRISFSWARLQPAAQGDQINGDVQTLAKQVTYHPVLQRLLFAPLKELAELRGEALSTLTRGHIVTTERNLTLGPWTQGAQSDVVISVRIPNRQATLYVSVSAAVRIKFYVDFQAFDASTAPTHQVEVGMLTDDPYPSIKDTLTLLSNDECLEIRLIMDNTVTEAFFQRGAVAMTVPTPLEKMTSVELSTDTAGAAFQVKNASAWRMGSAWISSEAALALRTS